MTAARDTAFSPRKRKLKLLCRELVETVGGCEASAEFCRAGKSQLSDYGNPNVAAFMPVDVLFDLESISAPVVTRWLAREGGYALLRVAGDLPADTDWCAALGEAVAEFTDVQTRLLAALPGGVSAAEIREKDIVGQVDEAMEKLAQLRALALRATEGC